MKSSAEQPCVSMVMTCYNKEALISGMLASVREQTWDNIEVILVNDGSTDGTLGVIRAWVPELESRGYRVRLIDQQNKGIAGAAYAGLGQVTGEYCCVVDADDALLPDYVGALAQALADGAYEWAVCDYWLCKSKDDARLIRDIDSSQTMWCEVCPAEDFILHRVHTGASKFMYRTSYLRSCGIFDVRDISAYGTQESHLLLPLAQGGGRLRYVPRPLYRYICCGSTESSRERSIDDWIAYARNEMKAYYDTIIRIRSTCEKRLLAVWELGAIKYAVQCAARFQDEAFERRISEELAAYVRVHIRPEVDIALERIIKATPIALIYALEFVLLGLSNPFAEDNSPLKPGGRVFVCGALGMSALRLIPALRHTPAWERVVLWDKNARPGDTRLDMPVCKPEFAALKPQDAVMIAPSDWFAADAVYGEVRPYTTRIWRYHDIVNYLAAHHFPDIDAACAFTEGE